MYGGLASENLSGITDLDRKPKEQIETSNTTINNFIDAITKIKHIIRPYALETQNPNGLQEFTMYLKYIYNCINKENCSLENMLKQNNKQLDLKAMNALNEQITILKKLKTKMDCIQCNYWLQIAFITNPNAYVNNLTSK